MNELKIKKCLKCSATINLLNDCECETIKCCNEVMPLLKCNTSDGASEKHLPTYEVEEDILKVRVNHIMENDHSIEWICLKTEDKEEFVFLKPNCDAYATFQKVSSGVLYAYCNKHGLWSTIIK